MQIIVSTTKNEVIFYSYVFASKPFNDNKGLLARILNRTAIDGDDDSGAITLNVTRRGFSAGLRLAGSCARGLGRLNVDD